MKTLTALRASYKRAQEQIANEKLTGDSYTDYVIRKETSEICDRRNGIAQDAWNEYQFDLKKEWEHAHA